MPRNKNITNHEKYNSPFPARLRLLMEQNNVTQQQLADVLSVRRQAVGRYTDGSSFPSYESLVQISRFLGVSVDYLTGNTDIRSASADVQSTVKYTGLSEPAANNLHRIKEWSNRELESFSLFIESEPFWEFLAALASCYRHFERIADIKQAQATIDVGSDELRQYIEGVNERDLIFLERHGKDAAAYGLYHAAINLADYLIEKSKERWGNNHGKKEHP